MAKKKSRVPTPPKRAVQAPKAYRAPRDPQRTKLVFIALGVAVAIAAAGVGIAMAVGSGGGGTAATGRFGPCVRETFPPMGRQHLQQLSKKFEYNSFPATSGPHNPTTAIWNVYDRPVPAFNLVHNLEHGGVIVQYGDDVPPATVQELTDWYADDPRGLVLAPRPRLGDEIALTAWTHLMTCTAFDEDAYDDFLDDYRGPQGDAPEKFELDALQPGGQ